MWVAIPHHQGRVSPVFDVASHLTLVRVKGPLEIERREVTLVETQPDGIARSLAALGVKVLICGAISQMLERLLHRDGVRVVAQVCGDVEAVLHAFVSRTIDAPEFCLEGCSRPPCNRRSHKGGTAQTAVPTKPMRVAVLGASNKPDRYSFKAVRMLREKGHIPYPVHPALPHVDGIPAWPSLHAIPVPIDTATVYLSARNQQSIAAELLSSTVQRVIFNPGAENPELACRLRQHGKEVLHACTLVLLTTGQFAKSAAELAQQQPPETRATGHS